MQRVKVIVASGLKVAHGKMTSILNSTDRLELVGRNGADVLEEACEYQPDLLVYELSSYEEEDYSLLSKIKNRCSWTKIIVFSATPLQNNNFRRLLDVSDGYMHGPLLPGFLLKAVELACYSGYFLYLGSSKYIEG